MNELALLLIKLRGKESLRDIAERAGISHTYLSHLEKGKDPRTKKPLYPSPDTLKALSKAYNYPYEELMIVAGYLDRTQSYANEDDRKQAELEEAKAKIRKVLSVAESKGKFSTTDGLVLEIAKVIDSAEIEYAERINDKEDESE